MKQADWPPTVCIDMTEPSRQSDPLDAPADNLSALAAKLLRFQIATTYQRLVVTGTGDSDARLLLETLDPADLLSVPVLRLSNAKCALAGLWLLHDWLDECHNLCQSLETPEGSFWHAIMHRREGDFSNAKYWYARVGNIPLLATLTAEANAILNPLPADLHLMRLVAHGWNPSAYVDLVEQAHEAGDSPRHKTLVALQQMEWRVLFDHCIRQAAV